MAVELKRDVWKIQFDRKQGIWIMLGVGILLLLLIIFNIMSLSKFDTNSVFEDMKNLGIENPTLDDANAFVRLKVILTIVGNTLILGFFSGLVWWSTNTKRFGYVFGVFWLMVFGVNTIAYPFYTVDMSAMSIVLIVGHGLLTIGMLVWIVQLMQHRARLRQELSRKVR